MDNKKQSKKEALKAEMHKVVAQIQVANMKHEPVTKLQAEFRKLNKEYKKLWLSERGSFV